MIGDLIWPLNSEVLHGMPFEELIINLEKDINDKYKHLENNITERTVYISEKDIEIFKNILDRNGGGIIVPRYEAESVFNLLKQLAG